MKGTRYLNGVLATQEHLQTSDNSKTAGIKERFGTVAGKGIVNEDGVSGPLYLYPAPTASVINVTAGEAYTDFNIDSADEMYTGSGERIYVPSALTNISRRLTAEDTYVYLVYIEIHKNREADEAGVNYYTKKEDGYVIAQLSTGEHNQVATTGIESDWTAVNHSAITSLTQEELGDTFGAGKYTDVPSPRVRVSVTKYNSVFLGRILVSPANTVDGSGRTKFTLDNDVIDVSSILQSAQTAHVREEHSTGIIGSHSAYQCFIDASVTTDKIVIIDLLSDEYAFIKGNRVGINDLPLAEREILMADFATTNTYYIYLKYNETTNELTSEISIAYPTDGTGYGVLILGSVYADTTTPKISAFNGDKRYDASISTNPITDLRVFGTMGADRLSDDGKNSFNGDSLIVNGDFEEGTIGGLPTGWIGTGTLDSSLDAGRKVLKLTPGQYVISAPIPFNSNNIYQIKAVVKGATSESFFSSYIRGYPSKDYIAAEVNADATYPINIGYNYAFYNGAVTTSWASLAGDILLANWTYTTPAYGGNHTSADLPNIKYARVVLRNESGAAQAIYIDNIKLIDKNGVTATAAELNLTASATSSNTANTLVKRDGSGNFSAGTITGNITGNAATVTTNANLTGHVTSVGNATALGSFTLAQLNTAISDADIAVSSNFHKMRVFTSSTSWDAATDAPGIVSFVVIGIGGGGGGGYSGQTSGYAGGGGGGAYWHGTVTTAGASPISVVIGAGGPGGIFGTPNGTSGGTTSFNGNDLAYGGVGCGQASDRDYGGDGGTVGAIIPGWSLGSSGTTGGNANPGVAHGAGGNAARDFPATFAGFGGVAVGADGKLYGGGGAGGVTSDGGDGKQGIVIVMW